MLLSLLKETAWLMRLGQKQPSMTAEHPSNCPLGDYSCDSTPACCCSESEVHMCRPWTFSSLEASVSLPAPLHLGCSTSPRLLSLTHAAPSHLGCSTSPRLLPLTHAAPSHSCCSTSPRLLPLTHAAPSHLGCSTSLRLPMRPNGHLRWNLQLTHQ